MDEDAISCSEVGMNARRSSQGLPACTGAASGHASSIGQKYAQPLFAPTIIRAQSLNALPKLWPMVVMDQMAKLMDHDIVHDGIWSDYDLPVELQIAFR